jgi:hypothetical protein
MLQPVRQAVEDLGDAQAARGHSGQQLGDEK